MDLPIRTKRYGCIPKMVKPAHGLCRGGESVGS